MASLIRDKKIKVNDKTFTLPRYYVKKIREIINDPLWLQNEPLRNPTRKEIDLYEKHGSGAGDWEQRLQIARKQKKKDILKLIELTKKENLD